MQPVILSTPDQFIPILELGLSGASLFREDLSILPLDSDEKVIIAGISRIVHVAYDMTSILRGTYTSGEEPHLPVIFDHPIGPQGISVASITRALWASYILSLEATRAAGKNSRAHTGRPSLVPSAHAVLRRLGIAVTPFDCVYGSSSAFWDTTYVSFDPEIGALTLRMSIGS